MPAARILSRATETLSGEREATASLTTWIRKRGWPERAVWATQICASMPAMIRVFLAVSPTRAANASDRKQLKALFEMGSGEAIFLADLSYRRTQLFLFRDDHGKPHNRRKAEETFHIRHEPLGFSHCGHELFLHIDDHKKALFPRNKLVIAHAASPITSAAARFRR